MPLKGLSACNLFSEDNLNLVSLTKLTRDISNCYFWALTVLLDSESVLKVWDLDHSVRQRQALARTAVCDCGASRGRK